MDKPIRIIFVCTGNTCRSSMAAELARAKIRDAQMGENAVIIESAGTGAFDGSPASPKAVEALKEKQLDLSGHRARRVTLEMLKEADYIFTMTLLQKQQILYLYPEGEGKIFTLKEFAFEISLGDLNIDDPYGYDLDYYRQCAQQLEEAISRMLAKVLC
ncbi:low molecular weight protein arginine phosphatase [Dehalobacterium formicoaceticum]|uniref:Low molecular weight protein arginine phosphatase n=1 Tax=Dehalobacterium formicoaceticum TaxID=51515 RepID=A0ABT1Y4F3_9FIRM|nr:low molecular weight protein arginine phosphatase [Dehalobacterium formicoaceticum]MCR6545438.1 low molecular weight protein arginine phosphatase [Dehalobacterium formicoaceticum]